MAFSTRSTGSAVRLARPALGFSSGCFLVLLWCTDVDVRVDGVTVFAPFPQILDVVPDGCHDSVDAEATHPCGVCLTPALGVCALGRLELQDGTKEDVRALCVFLFSEDTDESHTTE